MFEQLPDGRPVNPSILLTKHHQRLKGPAYNAAPEHIKDSSWKDEPQPWRDYIHLKGNWSAMHSSTEIHYLYRTAKKRGGNFANLGTFKGGSAAAIGMGLRDRALSGETCNGKVFAVDLFNHLGRPPEQYLMFMDGLRQANLLDRVIPCPGFTHEWPARLEGIKFDFVLIDADHYYETCKLDWDLWSPMVPVGGRVAFHDVNFITVDKVINEIDKSMWVQEDHVWRLKIFKRIT